MTAKDEIINHDTKKKVVIKKRAESTQKLNPIQLEKLKEPRLDITDKNKYEVLANTNKVIEKIIHISDIHISAKKPERHPEYRSVFDKLYREVEKLSLENPSKVLIVLTGDIADDKSYMNPAQIALLKEFLFNLSNINDVDVVAITGNHDENPSQNTLNSISPLLTNFSTKNNIYLLLDNKTYQYNNILFTLTTMYSNTVTPCNIETDKWRIALYHGTIHGSTNDANFDLSNSGKFNVTDFTSKGFDYVLLGDVHKFHYLNNEKTVWYSGSLIQQNLGEDINKGYVLLDLPSKTSKFCPIKNDWGFFKIKMNKNGVDEKDLQNLPKYPTIELLYENISHKEALDYSYILNKKYNAKCIPKKISNSMDLTINITTGGKKKEKLEDIKDNESLKRIMLKFIQTTNKYSDETKKDIELELDKIMKEINRDYMNKGKVRNFKLKKLEFSNVFKYGDNNVIDFSKMKNIVGLVAPSYSGKSSIISCIIYAIFGESITSSKTGIINVNKPTMKTKIEFSINNDNYIIKRSRTIKKIDRKDSKEEIELIKNGEKINEDTNDLTNQKITELFCNIDEFLDVSVMQQMKIDNFIYAKPSERKRILCKLLGLDIFTEIHSVAKSTITSIRNSLPKEFSEQTTKKRKKEDVDFNEKINTKEKEIKENEIEYKKLGEDIEKSKKELEIKKQKMTELEYVMKEFMKLRKEIEDYNDLEILVNELNETKSELETNIEKNQKLIEGKKKELSKLNDKLKKYKNMEKKNDKFNEEKKNKVEELNKEKNLLMQQKIYVKKINIDITETKNKRNNIVKQISKIENEIKELETNIKKNKSLIVDDEENKNKYEEYIKLEEEKQELYKKIEETTNKINNINISLDKLSKHSYNPDCKYCMSYSVTQDKLKYENELKLMKEEKEKQEKKNKILNTKLKKLKSNKSNYEKQLEINTLAKESIEKYTNKLNEIAKELENNKTKLNNIDRDIEEYNNYKQQEKKNDELNNKINNIDDEIKEQTNKVNVEYEEYTKLMKSFEKIKEEIKNIEFDEKHDKFELKKTEDDINKCKDKIKNIETNKEKFEESNKNEKELKKIKDEIKKIEQVLKEKETKLKKTDVDIIKANMELKDEREKIEVYKNKIKEISTLSIVVDCLGKDGLVNIILQENILPKLEQNVNTILEYMGEYKIKMSNNGQGVIIEKIENNGKIVDVYSGCELFVGSLAFKLAFGQINNFIKTPFLIMDESFVYCDRKNIEKIPMIFDYIKNNYDFAIVISHDDRIIDLYDTKIEINDNNGFSKIVFE